MEATVELPPPGRAKWKTVLCSFIVVIQSLTAGSIFTFPLFGPTLAKALNLSMQQTSTIASLGILSEYITAVLWGSLADRRGAASVSFGVAPLFVAGYLLMSSTLEDALDSAKPALKGSWVWVALFYMLPGSATAGSYFSAVSVSARLFPSRPGLAIGVPCAIFGLSPLFLSFIGDAVFRISHGSRAEDTFDAVGYLWMLGVLLGGVNLLSAVCLRFGGQNQTAVEASAPPPPDHPDHCSPSAVGDDGFDRPHQPNLTEETPLLSDSGAKKSALRHSSLVEFLKDPGMWALGIVTFLCIGPGEMTMASLGAIVGAIVPSETGAETFEHPPCALVLRARHVQVMSAVNTVSRLAVGWLSDWLSRPSATGTALGAVETKRISRLMFLAAAAALYATASFYVALGLEGSAGLWVLSISTGISYGAAFTLVPSIVASIWPLADFGRNWGVLSYFSAAGSFLYTLLFGVLYDAAQNPGDGSCTGRACFEASYILSAVSELVAIGLVALLWRKWRTRV